MATREAISLIELKSFCLLRTFPIMDQSWTRVIIMGSGVCTLTCVVCCVMWPIKAVMYMQVPGMSIIVVACVGTIPCM